jgi:hypothetical protein
LPEHDLTWPLWLASCIPEDLWQLCRDELTRLDVRTGGWDIRGRWSGVVVGATPRLRELRRGETIPSRVIAAQITPHERHSSYRPDGTPS